LIRKKFATKGTKALRKDVTCCGNRGKESRKKYLFFPIFGEEYLRNFVKRAFETEGKVGRKKAQKDFNAEDADFYSHRKEKNNLATEVAEVL